VEVDERPQQREADAQPALRPLDALLALHEELENTRQHLGLDAAAAIPDADDPSFRSRVTVKCTVEPGGEYLTALLNRFA
jgi:hypothetical protein